MDYDDGDDGDDTEHASICLATLDTLIKIAKSVEGAEKEALKDVIQEGLTACDTLKKVTDLGDSIVRRKNDLEGL